MKRPQPLKVLHIAPAWIDTPPKDYGGTEWVIKSLVDGLVDTGQNVTLFATKNSHTKAKLKYVFDKPFLSLDLPWTAALPPFIHYTEAFSIAEQYDIIHTHLSSNTDPMLMAFLAHLNKPAVMTMHSRLPLDHYSQMDPYFLKLYGPKITALGISKTMAAEIPVQFRNGGYIYNSLEMEDYQFVAQPKNYVTWIGKIRAYKGLHEAILAAKRAKETIIFAGVIDYKKPDSVEYFETKIKPLIDNKTVIFKGPADLKLKNELFGNAKAFLNPIQWVEPFGMVMVESMACGTPVISFNQGAAKELVVEGETGFLVNTVDEMVAALKKIKTIDRRHCRAHVTNNFTAAHAAKQAITIYRQEIARFNQDKSQLSPTRSTMQLQQPGYSSAYYLQIAKKGRS